MNDKLNYFGGVMKRSIILVLIVICTIIQCSCSSNEQSERVSSEKLTQTNIAATIDEKIVEGKNVLYCSSFQMAWDRLKQDILKGAVELDNQPLIANSLNSNSFDRKNIGEKNYVAEAGFVKDGVINKINQGLKEKFNTSREFNDIEDDPKAVLAYAYLYKKIIFDKDFEDTYLTFNSKNSTQNVKSFGIKNTSTYKYRKDIKNQVEIIDYLSDDDFIISIKSKSDDYIYIAKVKPKEKLSDTMQDVRKRIKTGKREAFRLGDYLSIPDINFNIEHSYNQLLNKYLKNGGFRDYYIREAKQDIMFKLSKSGALLKSGAAVEMAKSSSYVENPKTLIFDKPFLIILGEKQDKEPYFAMWVENTDAMELKE